ncbi:hypothetical protein L1D31_15815 [Vibrio sp. Isolate23]|uniref:hypothetical protein n=1 Tax=Vibrio sp. Isolate23 TaxID=2908533 RepID=UPI001EFCD544|nr:hypothetical protein [Vibrio sp. Isolate23]MCG9684027.1 hypothetical protein [Vibrio sp. Isolate23]
MKRLFFIVCSLMSSVAYSLEWTEPHVVERVHITTNGTYYFKVADGWGAESCKKAAYVFLHKNEAVAADAVLSLVLASQATGKAIKARGVCQDSGHFRMDYVIQMEAE